MNPQAVGQPGYPAASAGPPTSTTQAGTLTGPAVLPPPPSYVPPPQAPVPPPVYRRRRPGWLAVWVTLSLALLLALSATVMSVMKLSQSTPAATTTTVTAPPPPPRSYSPDQVAAAKKEACDASNTASASINAAQGNYLAASKDRQSPQYQPALANFQLVAMLETQYIQQHLPPATPKNMQDATNDYITNVIALADAHTRGLSDHDAQPFVEALRKVGSQLDKVCE
jgi:hypothetical protein